MAQRRDNVAIHDIAVQILGREARTHEEVELLAQLRAEAAEGAAGAKAAAKAGDSGAHAPYAPYAPYPAIDAPDFAPRLISKREFLEHQGSTADKKESRAKGKDDKEQAQAAWNGRCQRSGVSGFELTHVQIAVRNFLSPGTPYNGLLLFHGVGVGKTCAAVTVAEQYANNKSNNGIRNGILVLTRPGLRENFRKTIFDAAKVSRRPDGSLDYDRATQCTGTTYTDRVHDRRSLTLEQVEARVARLVRARYTFMGFGEFASVVASVAAGAAGEGGGAGGAALAAARLRERFSDMVIIVDEAHNLRTGGIDGNGETRGKRVTPALRRVLRCADNVKLLMLTATPMFNRASDVLDLVNLLLVNDKRPALRPRDIFDTDGALARPEGEAKLRLACQGYISYMRGDDPFSFPLRLAPSDSGDKDVMVRSPTVDIRGVAIPAERRLRYLEVVGSPLGEAQKDVYMRIEARMRELDEGDDDKLEEDNDEGERGEGERLKKPDNKTPFFVSMQASNIVYPRGASFFSAFKRVGDRSTQFEYHEGVPAFLSPKAIGAYAPKIGAVARRIASCQGVAMVYSRFVWDGLVPLALALEHMGFARFEAPPLLRVPLSGGGKEKQQRPRFVYAIISATRSIKSDEQRTIAALISSANREGAVIKAVLVSDSGSEGLDLRFVREVHVLEPWYHVNKLEQVIGRASRFCSHRDLPLEQRNITVYLHAATRPRGEGWGLPDTETVDLRAYRVAETKQVHILEVERILRASAFDCALNDSRMRRDADTGTRIDVVTSQGVWLRQVTLGRPARLAEPPTTEVQQPRCYGMPPSSKLRQDDSTYDPERHAFHRSTYRQLISSFFAATGRVSATHAELWEYVRDAYVVQRGDDPDRDRMSSELDAMLIGRVEVKGPRGDRRGTIIQRAARYLFQPSDEETHVLSDWDRGSGRGADAAPNVLDAETLMLSPPPLLQQPRTPLSPKTTQKSSIVAAVAAITRVENASAQLLSASRLPAAEYGGAAIDAAIDRMSRRRLLELCAVCSSLSPKEVAELPKHLRHVRGRVCASLKSANLIAACAQTGSAASAAGRRDVQASVVGAVIHPRVGGGGRPVFKVLDVALAERVAGSGQNKRPEGNRNLADGGRGSGCVCHQSSVLTSGVLRSLIDSVTTDSKVISRMDTDKRSLCQAYELMLRRHDPSAILRPGADRP